MECKVCHRNMTPISTETCLRCAEMIGVSQQMVQRLPAALDHLQSLPIDPLRIEDHYARWILRGMRADIQPGVNLELGIDQKSIEQYLALIGQEMERRSKEESVHSESGPAT